MGAVVHAVRRSARNGLMSHPRRFRFGVDLHAAARRPVLARHRPRGRGARLLDAVRPRPLRRGPRADRGAWQRPPPSPPRSTSARSSSTATSAIRPCSPASSRPIDLLSEGRLEVGLGAGWKRLDYERSGHPDGPAQGARRPHDRAHACAARACFAGGPVTFARRALHDHRPRRARRRRTGRADRRSSSAAGRHRVLRFAGRGRRHRRGERVDPLGRDRRRGRAGRARRSASTRRSGWVREGAGDASTTSSSTPGSPSPRSPTTADGVADAARGRRSVPTPRRCCRRR